MSERATAATLSLLLPGLGQIYLGARALGGALLTMSLSLWATALLLQGFSGDAAFSPSASLQFLYLLVLGPAVSDAWFSADAADAQTLVRTSRFYVLTMLGCLGPAALPLLWQSRQFGRSSKVVWTVLMALLTAGALWLLVTVGPALEELLRELNDTQLTPT